MKDTFLSTLSRILTAISPLQFDNIKTRLYIDSDEMKTYLSSRSVDSGSTVRIPPRICGILDDVLAQTNYNTITKASGWATFSNPSEFYHGDVVEPPPFACSRDMYHELLPRLAARGVFEECDGTCYFHMYVLCQRVC